MNKAIPLSIALAVSVAASIGFAGGYVFHLKFGQELPAARQALIEREASQRVLNAFEEVLRANATHKAISSVKSFDETKALQGRSKQAVLSTIERFSRIAGEAEDRRERLLAQEFLPQVTRIREALDAEP